MNKPGYGSVVISLILAINFLASGCAARAEKQIVMDRTGQGQMVLEKTGQKVTVTGCEKLKKEITEWNLAHPEAIKEYPC